MNALPTQLIKRWQPSTQSKERHFWHLQTDQRQRYRSAFPPDRYSRCLPWRVSQCYPLWPHKWDFHVPPPEPEAPTVHKVILSCSWTCLSKNLPQRPCRPPPNPGPLAQFPLPGIRLSCWHQGRHAGATQTAPSAKTRKQAVIVPMEGSVAPELKGGVPKKTGTG